MTSVEDILSARWLRWYQPRVFIDLDVFRPDGLRAVLIFSTIPDGRKN